MKMRWTNSVLFLILFSPRVKSNVGFSMDLDRQEAIFGEGLDVNITITPNEHVEYQTLEVRFPPKLLFNAAITSTTCSSADQNCETDSKTINDNELSNTGKFVFDNRVIEESKQLIVFNKTSNWEQGYVHKTDIQLTNVASSDLSGREFVVAVFRYWNRPRVSNEENGVQNFVGRNFTLYPAKIYVLIDGALPNKSAEMNKVYAGVEKSITVVAESDPRAGTILLKVKLPSVKLINTGKCPGLPTACDKYTSSNIPLLTVVKSTYSLGQGKEANKELEIPKDDTGTNTTLMESSSLLLTPNMLTDGSGGSCSGPCSVNLTALVITADEYAKPGQTINISGAINYGSDFEFSYETPPISLTIVGPELDLTLAADPNSELEAGMEVRLQANLRHSNTSTEDLVVPKVAFTFPNGDAVKLVSGSCTLAKNGGAAEKFDDANITRGILLGDFPLGSIVEITFRVTLTDALPLATKLPVKVGADFAFKRASDACLPAPCLHGGTCSPAENGQPAKCQCTPDFEGVDCSQRVCKRGNWKRATDSSYTCYYFPEKVLPFVDAAKECGQLGASLPSIHSAASDIWALASYWLNTLQNISEVWIGLHRDSSGSNWKWTDGLPANFYDWYDDNQQSGTGNCTISSSAAQHNYRWFSRNCSLGYYFFCADTPKPAVGAPRLNSRNLNVNLVSRSLQVKTDLGIGDRLRIHQPATITISFAMPFGTLQNAQLETIFTSDQVDPIPIIFVSSDLSLPSSINCSRTDILHATNFDFLVNVNSSNARKYRAKRAAYPSGGQVSIIRPLGTLVNGVRGGQSGATINLNATFLATDSPVTGFSGANFSMASFLVVNDALLPLGSKESIFAKAELMFNKSFQSSEKSPGHVIVTATVGHSPTSTGEAYDLNYIDDLECLRVRQVPKEATYVSNCREIRAKRSQLGLGDTMTVTYAVSADKGMDYEPSFRNATINYTSIQPGEFLYQEYPGQKGAMEVSTCIIRKDDVMLMDYVHLHLYSSLAFVLAVTLATLILLLMLYLYLRTKRANRAAQSDEEGLLENGDDAISNKSAASAGMQKCKGKGLEQAPVVDIGTMTADAYIDESIIAALIEPSPQQMYRRLDRMDIGATAAVEEQMNSSKLQNFIDCASAVTSVCVLDEKQGEEMVKTLKKRVNTEYRNVEQEYKEKLDQLRKTSNIKNGERMAELKSKHAAERQEAATLAENLSPLEGEAVVNSLKSLQQAELDDLMHKLQVEQELELQRIAEGLQAKKESLLLEIQSQSAKDMTAAGKIDIETADSLSQELEKANSEVLRWFDTERAHQRSLIEEKCQLRRHLALQKELWDQQYDESFETLIKQFGDSVEKGLPNETESQELREESKKQMQKMRDWYAKERRVREAKLDKAMAAEKKKRIAQMKTQHQKEIENIAKLQKEKPQTGPLDGIRAMQQAVSEQRRQLRALENRLDEEAAEELDKMYQGLEKELAQTLDEKKRSLLKSKNVPEHDITNIIAEHKEHLKILSEKHEFQRQKQLGKLKEVLRQLQLQANEQAEKEIAEQSDLRQHEKSIARMLIDQQASLSDADRDTLVRSQLQHLANMKNGLSVNQLRQIQLLEKKLAERKMGLLERLERRRHAASKTPRKPNVVRPRTSSSGQAGSSSMSSEDDRREQNGAQQMSLLDYTHQRLHILRDTTLNIDKEAETVRQNMVPERAQLLKEREEQLGEIVAQLQIEKAKQIVELEQQEDALANLTTCMVEDLNERDVLSNPDCHRILEKHQLEQQRLSERLQEQKEKQDLVLKQQLLERASKKHNVLEKKQRQLSESRPVTAVEHIDNVNLIHNYAMERERAMQQSERELEQALQEQRREFELKKRQALQDQEIDLINNLVQMGNFNKSEVSGVLFMLFPDKTKHEVKELAKKLYKTSSAVSNESKEQRMKNHTSLAKRLEMTARVNDLIDDRAASDSGSSSGIDIRRKRENGVRVQYPRPRSRPRTHLPPISRRPEPVGASVDQVAEYLPDRRLAKIATAQVSAPRQTYHQ